MNRLFQALLRGMAGSGLLATGMLAAPQTIRFSPIPACVFGDIFSVAPTTDAAGLIPVLTVQSGPATIAGNTVTTLGAGLVTLRASQSGNGIYEAAAAVTQTFTVLPAPVGIMLSALAQPYDGLPKQAVLTTFPAQVEVRITYDGSSTLPTDPGSYLVIATVDETNYQGVATGTLTIGGRAQSIEFAPIASHRFGDAPFAIAPLASSGLPVAVHVVTGPATISDNTVTLTGAGTVVLQATQKGSSRYAPATLARSFVVTKAEASVVLSRLAHRFNGSTPSVYATTDPAGLAVNLTYNNSAVAPSAPGSYSVVATINDWNYEGNSTGMLTIDPGPPTSLAPQAVSFAGAPLPNRTFGDISFRVNATASSGLPVTISVASGPATISNDVVTLTGAGEVTLLAQQAGNETFASTSVAQTFNVSKSLAQITVTELVRNPDDRFHLNAVTVPAGLLYTITYNGGATLPYAFGRYTVLATINSPDYAGSTTGTLVIGPDIQTIIFPEIADRHEGDEPFLVQAAASSGLPVMISVVSGPAQISHGVVTLTGPGVVVLQATQPGNIVFQPASMTRSFTTRARENLTPVVSLAPRSQTVPVGNTVTLTVGGVGTPAPVYQWYFNSRPMAGATAAELTISKVQPSHGGLYSVTLSNVAGTVMAPSAVLTVVSAATVTPSRIVNFSARGFSGPGSDALVMGFVVSGRRKDILVRGVGPSLQLYGIANAVADPVLSLYSAQTLMATNDDWQVDLRGHDNGKLLDTTSASVGAFPLAVGGKDSALILTLEAGAHTAALAHASTGVALTEVYDYAPNPGSYLVNVSARMKVSPAEGTLIAGLAIAGDAPKTVLLRGIGPALAGFGVSDYLVDPQLSVYSGDTILATNDNWDSGPNGVQVANASARVGAFALRNGSKDAGLVVTLQPGSYTVQISGAAASSGVSLVEVYDVP